MGAKIKRLLKGKPLKYEIVIKCSNCWQTFRTVERSFKKAWHVGAYPECTVCGVSDWVLDQPRTSALGSLLLGGGNRK